MECPFNDTSIPPSSSNVNSEELENVEGEEPKKFRIQAKKLFLTWAQVKGIESCDPFYLFERLSDHVGDIGRGGYVLKEAIICKEMHMDGGWHIHAAICLTSKPDIRDVRAFDMRWGTDRVKSHPNIKVKFDWMEKVEYCMKDGQWYEYHVEIFKNSKGFGKKFADHKAWVEYRRQKILSADAVWPMLLPCGTAWQGAPFLWAWRGVSSGLVGDLSGSGFGGVVVGDPAVQKFPPKRVNWVIVGPPNTYKTTWVENTFCDVKIFKPSEGELAFDDYNGERFIIFDDWIPEMSLILNCCNVYRTRTPCWGKQRYNRKYWPVNQIRIVFILANVKRWRMAKLHSEEGFMERFNFITWNDKEQMFESDI